MIFYNIVNIVNIISLLDVVSDFYKMKTALITHNFFIVNKVSLGIMV